MVRYYATTDLSIPGFEDEDGRPHRFKAGAELVGVPKQKLANLLRCSHAEAREEEDSSIPPVPPADPSQRGHRKK